MVRVSRLLNSLAAGSAAAVLVPATAGAATLTTDLPCYVDSQPMTISGTGWPAGAPWDVQSEQVFAFGTTDAAGNFETTSETAPIIPAIDTKVRTFTLTGQTGDQTLATTRFKVVNFLVKPKSSSGRPTGFTSWGFSGFLPGKAIYVHVKRGKRTWTQRAGKGSKPCGTLRSRLRRLPAVPPSQVRDGKYEVFVDNRKRLSKGGRQYRATVTIF